MLIRTKKIISVLITTAVLLSMCGCELLDSIRYELENTAVTSEGVYIIETENIEAINVDPRPIDDNEQKYLYCYAQLDSEQKRIYRILLEAVDDMQTGWISLKECEEDFAADIAVAYQALSNDHPEFFWMPYTYLLSNSGSESEPRVLIALSSTQNDYSCDYLISSADRESMERRLDKRIDEITAEVTGMTIYRTELYLHDLICRETTYTLGDAEELVFTAYGALINGKAVCEGYSRAMQLLCKRLGIPCALVTGVAEGEGHMWNIIDPGDGWYHLDVTWDDAAEDNIPIYSFFNLTDDEIEKTHSASGHFGRMSADTITTERSFNIVKENCTSTSYNYFVHEGLEFDENYLKSVTDSIILAEDDGETQLQFRFADETLAARFSENYESFIYDIQNQLNGILGARAPRISNIAISDIYVTLYWE